MQAHTDDVSYLCSSLSLLSFIFLFIGTRFLHILQTEDWGPQWHSLDKARSGSVKGEDLYLAMVGAAPSTSNLNATGTKR